MTSLPKTPLEEDIKIKAFVADILGHVQREIGQRITDKGLVFVIDDAIVIQVFKT